jgi:hypothetical protein
LGAHADPKSEAGANHVSEHNQHHLGNTTTPRAAKLCRHEGHWYTKAGSKSGTYCGRCDELSYDQAKTLFRQYLASLKSQRERRRLPMHSVIRICASTDLSAT